MEEIHNGNYTIGDILPSLNQISEKFSVSKETAVKSYKHLEQRGIISSVKSKGFYVTSNNDCLQHNVFLLLATCSAYHMKFYEGFSAAFKNGKIDVFFHHFNIKVLERLIFDNKSGYTEYVIIPFENEKLESIINTIPKEKLYIADRNSKALKSEYSGIYQNFENDIYCLLQKGLEKLRKYNKLIFIFADTLTEPPLELMDGFKRFCSDFLVHGVIVSEYPEGGIKKGECYLVIDDKHLVRFIKESKLKGFKNGIDTGIISYNDTPLKEIVGEGISVISTDFYEMGEKLANMIRDGNRKLIVNKSKFINRGSF